MTAAARRPTSSGRPLSSSIWAQAGAKARRAASTTASGSSPSKRRRTSRPTTTSSSGSSDDEDRRHGRCSSKKATSEPSGKGKEREEAAAAGQAPTPSVEGGPWRARDGRALPNAAAAQLLQRPVVRPPRSRLRGVPYGADQLLIVFRALQAQSDGPPRPSATSRPARARRADPSHWRLRSTPQFDLRLQCSFARETPTGILAVESEPVQPGTISFAIPADDA